MEVLNRMRSNDDWREELDNEIRRKLEKLLKRIKSEEDAYKKSDHEAISQLWVAVAETYSMVKRVDNRLRSIEEMLEGKKDDKGMKDRSLRDSLENY